MSSPHALFYFLSVYVLYYAPIFFCFIWSFIILHYLRPLTWFTRYIKASKTRFYYSGSQSYAVIAQEVLLYVFENILKLLHPFMPFLTEELWQVVLKSLSHSLLDDGCTMFHKCYLISPIWFFYQFVPH